MQHFLPIHAALFPACRSALYATGLLLALSLAACKEEVPLVSLGLDAEYYQPRMAALRLEPALTGEAYRWTLRTPDGRDSLVSTEKDYTFLQAEEGAYLLTFEIADPATPYSHTARIHVVHEETEYSPYISEVIDYRPAPGQFVNLLPAYEEGDTEADMLRKAGEAIAGEGSGMVSLGSFGGYVTFRFDHTVMNRPGAPDLAVYGNEADDKIIAVLHNDATYRGYGDITELPHIVVERLKHYFLTYKDMPASDEPAGKKSVEIVATYGREEAYEVIRRSLEDYKNHFESLEEILRHV